MNQEQAHTLTKVLLSVAVVILLLNSWSLAALSPLDNTSGSILGGHTPQGIPAIYGEELGISYDDVSPADQRRADAAIKLLSAYDTSITLQGKSLERYITILYTLNGGISCEYCCGARSVIFADGKAACGCAHSYAMRGLTKYLLTTHADNYTDEQIQEEVAKWKFLFFPGQMEAKAGILEEQGVDASYANIGSNAYRGAEKGASAGSGMVGGC